METFAFKSAFTHVGIKLDSLYLSYDIIRNYEINDSFFQQININGLKGFFTQTSNLFLNRRNFFFNKLITTL